MSFFSMHRVTVLVLAGLLTVQLTGLTCLQDGQNSSLLSHAVAGAVLGEDGAGSFVPLSQSAGEHDCPCHYLIAHPSSLQLESAFLVGELVSQRPDSLHDGLPSFVFHPPLVLS